MLVTNNLDACRCPCHSNAGVRHVMACCGQCPVCKQNIKFFGFDAHVGACRAAASQILAQAQNQTPKPAPPPDLRKLAVCDEAGNDLYVTTRHDIHHQGLLHKEIHVFFFTDDGKVVFQHRADDKDTYPGLLCIAVGGHVEVGQTFEQAALMEMREETGICAEPTDLIFLEQIHHQTTDVLTGTVNNALRATYATK